MKLVRLGTACMLFLSLWPSSSRAQDADETPPTILTGPNDAGEEDDPEPRRQLIKWNEYDGPISTFRFGLGFLLDAATYDQDDESEQQVGAIEEEVGVRDSRLLFRGKFKTKRPLSWTLGYMYDSNDESWRFRKTGLQIGFPEAKGDLFIGRTKEGYSMIKVMVGYNGWTQERSPALDTFVPILADGVSWMGYLPERRIFYTVGVFGDQWSEDESFATYDQQVATRIGWLPIASEERETVLHVAIMGRVGDPDEGSIRFRSKPEESLSPFFVETPKFEADRASTRGAEIYYREGSWLFGGEYNWQSADATATGEENFHGGNMVATWLVTGETRGYNARGGWFEAVSPDRTVFEGGPGALEAVFNVSYIDLDSGNFAGGKMWRLTPMINWHLSDNIRFELGYGYAVLDRLDFDGHTQFIQSRLQLQL